MYQLTRLIKKVNELRIKRDELKAELVKIEQTAYRKWREKNSKDRTAMDKVIAVLKEEDKAWQQKEEELLYYANAFTYLKNVLDIAEGMLGNPNYTKEDLTIFLNEFQADIENL